MKWRLLHSGHLPGAMNMAVDEAILLSVAQGGPPTLRFYGWEPPAVSIGAFQDLEREIDLDTCKSLGVDVVRRPTGGRAVLHDVEVTYSLIVPEESGVVPKGITESYRAVSEGMIKGLEALGLDAKMVSLRRAGKGNAPEPQEAREQASSEAQEDVPGKLARHPDRLPSSNRYVITVDAPDRRSSSAACFDAPSWYEVTVDGKKVVGSAQMRRHGVLLQHGSIPLELDAEKLFACLKFSSPESRARAKEAFLAKATSIRAALARPVSFMETSEAVTRGLSEALGVQFVEGKLTPKERETAKELARSKYARLDWHKERGRHEIQTA